MYNWSSGCCADSLVISRFLSLSDSLISMPISLFDYLVELNSRWFRINSWSWKNMLTFKYSNCAGNSRMNCWINESLCIKFMSLDLLVEALPNRKQMWLLARLGFSSSPARSQALIIA